jgi:ribosomal protein S9
MSQTPCKRCSFPLPICWSHAGGDLAQPSSIHHCADRALTRYEHPPKGLLHPTDLPSADTQIKFCQRYAYHRARRPH